MMTIEPQPPVSVEPQIVELSSARVVLTVGYDQCTGSPTFLVPSYLFGPGDVGPVVAVGDDDLQTAATGAAADKTVSNDNPCPVPPADDPAGKRDPGVEPQPAPDAPTGRPTPAPAPAAKPAP
jgi:hypothetical protein